MDGVDNSPTAGGNGEIAFCVDGGAGRLAAAVHRQIAVRVNRVFFRNATIINAQHCVITDRVFVRCRAGMDRNFGLGKSQIRERVGCECDNRLVVHFYISAIFLDIRGCAAGGDDKVAAGIHGSNVCGSSLVDNHASARVDDGAVRVAIKRKNYTGINRGTGHCALEKHFKPSAGADRGAVRSAAGGDFHRTTVIDSGVVYGA